MVGHMAKQSSFLGQTRHSGSGLAIVIGLHGAAIAIAFLMKSGVIPVSTIIEPMQTIEITRPQTPDPLPPPPADPRAPPPLPVSHTPVRVTPNRLTIVEPQRLPPTPPLQPQHPVIVETVPEPIMIAARIDPSHRGALQPRYPSALIRQEVEGSCTIRVHIAANGRVIAAEPVRATHPAFCEATQRQALSRWRFQPATRDGVAVDSWQQHVVEFRIS